GAEVPGEGGGVILPERLVEAEGREHRVARGPHDRAPEQAVADPSCAQRPGEHAVGGPPADPGGPVRGVVGQPGLAGLQLPLRHTLEHALGQLGGGGGRFPVVQALRGLPDRERLTPAPAAVLRVLGGVHGGRPGGRGYGSPLDGAEGTAAWLTTWCQVDYGCL